VRQHINGANLGPAHVGGVKPQLGLLNQFNMAVCNSALQQAIELARGVVASIEAAMAEAGIKLQ